jgi:hypothetical protein
MIMLNFFGVIEATLCTIVVSTGADPGFNAQQCTNKTPTTGPFGNACEAGKFSPKVEAGGLQDAGVCNQAGTQICDNNTLQSLLLTLRR